MGISQEMVKYSKVKPELIYHLNEWIFNHPLLVNSKISNDALLVHDPERPGKKIKVSKFLLQKSIYELHDYLIYEKIIYQLK